MAQRKQVFVACRGDVSGGRQAARRLLAGVHPSQCWLASTVRSILAINQHGDAGGTLARAAMATPRGPADRPQNIGHYLLGATLAWAPARA